MPDNLQSLTVSQTLEVDGTKYDLHLGPAGMLIAYTLGGQAGMVRIPWPALQPFYKTFRELILSYAKHKDAASAQSE